MMLEGASDARAVVEVCTRNRTLIEAGWLWVVAVCSCLVSHCGPTHVLSPLGHARGVKSVVGAVLEAHALPAQAWHVELRADAVRGEWLASGGGSASGAWCSCKGHCSNVPSSCARWQPLFWQLLPTFGHGGKAAAQVRVRGGAVSATRPRRRAQRNRALEVLGCLCAHLSFTSPLSISPVALARSRQQPDLCRAHQPPLS